MLKERVLKRSLPLALVATGLAGAVCGGHSLASIEIDSLETFIEGAIEAPGGVIVNLSNPGGGVRSRGGLLERLLLRPDRHDGQPHRIPLHGRRAESRELLPDDAEERRPQRRLHDQPRRPGPIGERS
jgi:hypothetical protein